MNSLLSGLLGPNAAQDASANLTGGFLAGTVTENNNKDFQGLVKVEFTSWLSGKNICEWIPVLQQYTGKTYGSYVIPEIGDIVLVGFMGTSMKKPFVMGSFYPANADFVKESFQEKNFIKSYKTKGGTQLIVNDEADKQATTLTTPIGLKMSLEDETQLVTISDKEAKNSIKLDAKNGAIEVVAEKNIKITCGQSEITIDSEGAINIKCKEVTVKANANATIEATQALNLKGAQVKATAQQQMSISGSAMTEIKGGILKLN